MDRVSKTFLSCCSALVTFLACHAVLAADMPVSQVQDKEVSANTLFLPKSILKTGVSLTTLSLSPNAQQLSHSIGLTPVLQEIRTLKRTVESTQPHTMEKLEARQDLYEAMQRAQLIIQRTSLEVDFVLAEINAEDELYQEVLSGFSADRDRALARINAASFVSNGALWAVCEALAIPTVKRSKYAISSGITGIIAGLVPSAFSLYTLKAVNGKRKNSEESPNMLAKVFGYPTTSEIEYPNSVWTFLTQVPANESGKTRSEQLIDRWIADANIPSFTHRGSHPQLDVITASHAQPKGLSIATLTARSVMLEQLAAEVQKMKRMLLELNMAVQGEKQLPS